MFDLKPTPLSLALRVGALLLPLAVAGWFGFDAGRRHAASDWQTRLASLDASHARALQTMADARAAELGAALIEQQRLDALAQQTGRELIATRARLADSRRELTRRIDDATRHDGDRFTGLGPDSLRVYRAARGYPERDPAVPAADAGHAAQAGAATGADTGLPAADLLEHAADYGQWCRQLDAQLSAFLRLHGEPGAETPE